MVDSQHRLLVRRLWVGRLPDAFAQPFPRVLLEEALLGYPARTADERKRAAGDIGRDVRPHLGVIVRETRLGDSRVGPVEPVRMGEHGLGALLPARSEEHTSELQSLMRISS